MGQTARTTKLLVDLSTRGQGGANTCKRCYLEETVKLLDAARAFYLTFFLTHPEKLLERVEVISTQTGEVKEALISADKLLSLSRNIRRWKPRPIPNHSQSGTRDRACPDFPNRYRHLKRVAKKQWQAGKPVKGERSNQQLWRHMRGQNTDTAHKTARAIVEVCDESPGCVLLFERLRVMKARGASKSRRLNRKQANQLKGKINQLAKEKAYASGVVSVEVNAHGTSQYCSRCGARGLRFSLVAGSRVPGKGGKLFFCPVCHYECHADFNASCNVHHSFFREYHWQPPPKGSG